MGKFEPILTIQIPIPTEVVVRSRNVGISSLSETVRDWWLTGG